MEKIAKKRFFKIIFKIGLKKFIIIFSDESGTRNRIFGYTESAGTWDNGSRNKGFIHFLPNLLANLMMEHTFHILQVVFKFEALDDKSGKLETKL